MSEVLLLVYSGIGRDLEIPVSLQLVAMLNSRNSTAKQCMPVQMANYPASKLLKTCQVHMVFKALTYLCKVKEKLFASQGEYLLTWS